MTAPTLQLPVKVLRSASAGRRPGDGTFRALTDGELFINTQDRVACMLDASGALFAWPIDPHVLATQAFVTGNFGAASPSVAGTAATGSATTAARSDHVHPTDTSRAKAGVNTDLISVALTSMSCSGTGTFGANVVMTGASPYVTLTPAAANQERGLLGNSPAGKPRWRILLGDSAQETGSNAGSNFSIYSWSDDASSATPVISFNRSSSVGIFAVRPTWAGFTPYDNSNLTAGAVGTILGYTPARPSGFFSAGGSANDFSANGSYFVGAGVNFVATANNVMMTGYLDLNHQVDVATQFFTYLYLFDVTANVGAYQSATIFHYQRSSINPLDCLIPVGGAGGLTIGHTYQAQIVIQRGQANGPTAWNAAVYVGIF